VTVVVVVIGIVLERVILTGIYVYTNVCIYVYIYTYACIHMHVYTYARIRKYHRYLFVYKKRGGDDVPDSNRYLFIYRCMNIYVCVCMYIHMYV
jgi:hypothetical protein